MKSAIIVFPGSNCDRDAVDALKKVGSSVQKIWYQENELPKNLDLVVIPGGFSYGDYLRSGAMAAISPAMQAVKKSADQGLNVLGICNGFQILTESGLLPGVLLRNKKVKFICKTVNLRVENNNSNFTKDYQKGEVIKLPIAHMDGNFFADAEVLKKIEDEGQVAFRYVNENGANENNINDEANPNGALNNIAGIFNQNKNILGLMPHPERAIDLNTGSQDGIRMFESLLNSFK